MKKTEILQEQRDVICKIIADTYNTSESYNTDILVYDGSVLTNNYYGNVFYGESPTGTQLIAILSISSRDKQSMRDYIRGGLSEAQYAFVLENGWVSMMETQSDDPADFEEFRWSYNDDEIQTVFDTWFEAVIEKEVLNL